MAGDAAKQPQGMQEVIEVTAVNDGHRPVEVAKVARRDSEMRLLSLALEQVQRLDARGAEAADRPQPTVPRVSGNVSCRPSSVSDGRCLDRLHWGSSRSFQGAGPGPFLGSVWSLWLTATRTNEGEPQDTR